MAVTIIQSAYADWNQSIIGRDTMETLFLQIDRDKGWAPVHLEACQLVLAEQSTRFAWAMFDEAIPLKQLRAARALITNFATSTSRSTYPPPFSAIRQLDAWLSEELRRPAVKGRPRSQFDERAYPWLIAFFETVFTRTATASSTGPAAHFILGYFQALRIGLDSKEVNVLDPENRGRHPQRQNLTKTPDAIAKAIGKFKADSVLDIPIIKMRIASVVRQLDRSSENRVPDYLL